MLDHLGIIVTNPAKSFPFYEACLAPLGLRVRERLTHINAIILYGEKEYPFLFIGVAKGQYHVTNLDTSGFRPVHLSFIAPSIEAVDEFHRQGLTHGGRDNGVGEKDDRGHYSAFLLDPDGNNIEAGFGRVPFVP
jgi:catechol 2,3-dioxygenase-like lactoylglutathione lyase family enzyme